MINVEMIKERVSVPALLERYGVEIERGGRCACPIHHGKNPNFAVKDRWFKCFKCGKSGSVIDLYMALNGVGFPQAIEELNSMFGLNLVPSKPSEDVAIRLALARHKREVKARNAQKERNDTNYTLICYLRRWLAQSGKDCTSVDKVLDYYQAYDGNDQLPDAEYLAEMVGHSEDYEVMLLEALVE